MPRGRSTRSAFVLGLLAALCVACAARAPTATTAPSSKQSAPERAVERVVLVSVDGLRPADCARLPTLGVLAKNGAFAAPPDGALSVLPSVTYPSHTTMVTGARPARHGIYSNIAPDPTPDKKNESGWRWYREDVKVDTLYDLAFDAGLRTALVQWPVTVGARATALLPEMWRAGTADDAKLVRALSTPGLFEQVERRFPGFSTEFAPSKSSDQRVIDVAITLLENVEPNLMFVHIVQVDSAEHEYGPDAPEAEAARLNADTQVKRLLDAMQASPAWPRSVLVVASDHGFLPISNTVAPMVHLIARGLGERVWMGGSSGLAYFYLVSETDHDAAAQARSVLAELSAQPGSGIGALLDPKTIAELGGDPGAFLAVEPAIGFAISSERTGEVIVASKSKGTHGYLPQRPEMRATLLFYGPQVQKGTLRGAALADIAPTIAPWLGLTLPNSDGKPLSVALAPLANAR